MQRTVTDAEHPPKKLHGKAEQTKVNDAKGPGRFQIGPFGNGRPSYYFIFLKYQKSL